MISLDAIKGLLAEQWNKDIRAMISKFQMTGAMERSIAPDHHHRYLPHPSRVQPAVK